MRFYRNLIILAVVFAALLAAYMLLPKQGAENAEAKKISVKSIDKSKISNVELSNSKGIFSFAKSGTDWKMEKPKDYKLDTISTDSFIDSIANIKADDVVEDNPQDLSKYGLQKPEASVTIKSTDGTFVISLGNETPIGGAYYLKTADSTKVYRVDSYTAGEFLRGLTEFRDKAVFNFNQNDVSELTLSKEGKDVWKLSKQTDWKVTETGKKGEGNQSEISNVVDEVSGLKVQKYVIDSSTADLAGFGLSKPQYVVDIKMQNGSGEKLLLGNTDETGAYYAKKESGTDIFTLSKDNLNLLTKDPKTFIKSK